MLVAKNYFTKQTSQIVRYEPHLMINV